MGTPAELLFVSSRPRNMEPKNSVGAKYLRLLDRLDLAAAVKGKRTAIKMHLGAGAGFTTIHPWLVRKLVEKVKEAGAKQVFVTDTPSAVRGAAERGYTQETICCPLLPTSGSNDGYYLTRRLRPAFKTLREIQLAGELAAAEALVDFSHIKAHGDCGFGGAIKNLAMGAVTNTTRRALHALEGGIVWDRRKCTRCKVCVENCPNHAIRFTADNQLEVFYHHCKFCQHCVLICPQHALKMVGGGFKPFQQGLALAAARVLDNFPAQNVLYINVLLNITLFCDCWSMTSPTVVPDIGIIAGRDIVAIEQASLDLVTVKDLIRKSLPPGWPLGAKGHLFERLHHKDPAVAVEHMEKLGRGTRQYRLTEVE
jgi:hypothetical protein